MRRAAEATQARDGLVARAVGVSVGAGFDELVGVRLGQIRVVTLDLDETMLDRRATYEVFIRGQMRRFAHYFEAIDREAYLRRVLELDRDGDTPKPEVFASAAGEFRLAAEASGTLAADFQDMFPDQAVVFPGLAEVLRYLRSADYRVGLITNGGSEIQRRKIEAMGIEGAFHCITISEEEGCRKPDPEIFHRTLARLGAAPEHAVHVGDNPHADIFGAKDAGLRAVWTRSRRWAEPENADAVIESIADLPGALRGLSAR